MGRIFETLGALGLTSAETRQVLARRTRDRDDVTVWRDERSRVIYIDDFYVGEQEYRSGEYRARKGRPDYERLSDARRRLDDYARFYAGNRVCDVGCGEGHFLLGARDAAAAASGVELQLDCIEHLRGAGVDCADDISKLSGPFDTIFMFHALEHFPDPLAVLGEVIPHLAPGGRLVAEVPHANDFLISTLESRAFLEFTLWSQHLILHTRESLRRLLQAAGLPRVLLEGRQRYPLSNHLTWLAEGAPGGHKGALSTLDTPDLGTAYENALRKLDATDTLVAVAER